MATLPIVVVDIDGTLARRGDRSPYDWRRVGEDRPNTPVITTVAALSAAGHPIVIVSGRKARCRDQTAAWLREHLPFPTLALHMRASHDNRPDVDVKREIHDRHLAGRQILCVFDDRDGVVALWRELGHACFQVAPGDF